MKKIIALAALFLLPALAQASELRFANGNVLAQASWEKAPKEGEEAVLHLAVVNAKDNSPLKSVTPSVQLWMPAMGHGSSPTKVTRVGDAFRISNLYFVMAGEWEIRITLQFKDGSSETQSLAVNIE